MEPGSVLDVELVRLWRSENAPNASPGEGVTLPYLVETGAHLWRVEEVLNTREVAYAQRLDFGEERWVFTIVGELAYLFRLDSDGGLETIVLGPLQGGEYRERVADGGKAVESTFKHPRLPGGQLVVTGSVDLNQAGLRSTLRTWAETPAPRS